MKAAHLALQEVDGGFILVGIGTDNIAINIEITWEQILVLNYYTSQTIYRLASHEPQYD